ncbi:type II toxin-antitoxin system VapC family toxin [Rhizobium sp. NPDC090275]|uniref:type II toxin-antitoxin system VapC family toxin n=1 Tax=Rhizobium sp. NPDC090275 TaxID=3364498 RepID=UPI000DDC9F3F
MDQFGRIYLDTNLFILAFETESDVAVKATLIMSKAKAQNPPRFVTSELTLAELLVLPYRQNNAWLVGLYHQVFSGSWLDIQPVTRDILLSAARHRATNPARKLPDAVHVATAIGGGCTHLLSSDKRIGPGPNEALPFALAKPDDATLTSLIESLS